MSQVAQVAHKELVYRVPEGHMEEVKVLDECYEEGLVS